MCQEQTTIYTAGSVMQAHLLKNALADAGITAVVTNELLEKGSGVDVMGWATSARVVVDRKDAERARRMALDFDRAAGRPTEDVDTERSEEHGGDDISSEAWPQCPECDTLRPATCPYCKTTGTDFRPADLDFLDSADQILPANLPPMILMCSFCLEPFAPGFPRRCTGCDHEFDDGVEIDDPGEKPPEELGARVFAVVFGLLALGVALGVYFMWLV